MHSDAFVSGHPKYDKLLEILLEHFARNGGLSVTRYCFLKIFFCLIDASKVIVFTEYRLAVTIIADMLKYHEPTIRAMPFTGQGATNNTRGVTQKEQKLVGLSCATFLYYNVFCVVKK